MANILATYITQAKTVLGKKMLHDAGHFYVDPIFKDCMASFAYEVWAGTEKVGMLSGAAVKQYAENLQKEADSWKSDWKAPAPVDGYGKPKKFWTHQAAAEKTARSFYRQRTPTCIRDLYALPAPCEKRDAAIKGQSIQTSPEPSVLDHNEGGLKHKIAEMNSITLAKLKEDLFKENPVMGKLKK